MTTTAEQLTRTWEATVTDRRSWDTDPTRAFHAKLDTDSIPTALRGFVTRYGLDGPWMACGATSTEAVTAFHLELTRRLNLALDQATGERRRAQSEYDALMEAIVRALPTEDTIHCPDHPTAPVENYTTGRRCSQCLRLV